MNVLDAIGGWALHSGPLYRRLASAIEAAVARGDLPPGTLLPPERTLAQSLVVGRSTVVGAYDLLRTAGVVVSRQGSGSWIAGAERNAAHRGATPESLRGAALSGGESLIDLATASLPAHPAVRQALGSWDDALLTALLNETGYSVLGLTDLRRAVANQFSREGLPTTTDQILITTGDQQALALITHQYCELGDTVVVEDPTSAGMLDLLRALPVSVRSSRSLSSTGHEGLVDQVHKYSPRLVYVMPCLGPEGRNAAENDVRRLASALRGFDGVLIEDTSSRPLLREPAPTYLAALTQRTTVLTVGSMSKLFWAGLRVGWIRGDANLILRLSQAKARADLGTPLLSQLVSAWLIHRTSEVQTDRVLEITSRMQSAETAIKLHLPDFALCPNAGGLTSWMGIPHGASRPFTEIARRHGVAVVSGAALSPGGSSDGFVRVALGVSDTTFLRGIERLEAAWTDYSTRPTDRGKALDEFVII